MGSSPSAAATFAAAARIVEGVARRGQSVDAATRDIPHAASSAVRAVALGTLRWYLRLLPALRRLLRDPASVTPRLESLLTVAAHQVVYARTAAEVSVNAAVDATRLIGVPRAAPLANAVLRRFVRERAELFAELDQSLPVRTAHPDWLVQRLLDAWPGQAPAMLEANNEHPPMVLRVDRTRTARHAMREELRARGIESSEIQWADTALELARPMSVNELPGFAEGRVSVQDAGAQLAPVLLDARPGERVLDACAAPGGKTGALLEHTPGIHLTALDLASERVVRIAENLRRLGREARLVTADLRRPQDFWDGQPYARILLDVPCSSTGVIRRHPDIKLLRRPGDAAAFARQQGELLHSALTLLAPGGRLLYATCSVCPEENEEVVGAALAAESKLRVAGFPPHAPRPPGAQPRPVGLQLLPGADAGTDGFYYACLEKTTA